MGLQGVIRTALIKVLTTIQLSSGSPLPELTDSLKPLSDLEGFNSEIWPIASGMLQIELGIQIPGKVNIFEDAITRKALTIAEIVERLESNYQAWIVPSQASMVGK